MSAADGPGHTPAPLRPLLQRLVGVARALGPLCSDIVFIGGSIAPLLQSDPAIPSVRPTKDVDGIVASTTYSSFAHIQTALRQRGFREDVGTTAHARRWLSPGGTPFDLVPAGVHLGTSGNQWDTVAIETADETEIAPGLFIRHASGPGFLALKWAAFRDRGASAPFASHDLEDILALVASRPSLIDEVAHAPSELRSFIRENVERLLADPDVEDLITAHLGNAMDRAATCATTTERLRALRGNA